MLFSASKTFQHQEVLAGGESNPSCLRGVENQPTLGRAPPGLDSRSPSLPLSLLPSPSPTLDSGPSAGNSPASQTRSETGTRWLSGVVGRDPVMTMTSQVPLRPSQDLRQAIT